MTAQPRAATLRVGARLELFTVIYNLGEGVAAIVAAILAGSPALFGYALQSGIESGAGAALLWRFGVEESGRLTGDEVERIERRTERLVAVSLVAVAVLVGLDAVRRTLVGERPEPSLLGLATAAVALLVQPWLLVRKRRTARALGSPALLAEASQTLGCIYLSAILFVALALNAGAGWWWADPLGALVIAGFLVREAREAWQGREAADG